MDGKAVSDLGEFGLIERLRRRLADAAAAGVEIGPGDDAAAVDTGPSTLLAADMLVEGIHFDLAFSSLADAGYKAVAVNVSDIAAMGGMPRYLLVSLGLPEGVSVTAVDALYDGMLEAAGETGCAIVGGDVTGAPQIVVSVSVAGEPGPAGVLRRSGAQEGDVLCVTGALGVAGAGLALMRAAADPRAVALLDAYPALAAAHRRPLPRVAAGPAAAEAGAHAMIDVSDGFARDAAHIAEESGLGLVVDGASLPVTAGVSDAAGFLGVEAAVLAASGGDDYELAIAVPPDRVEAVRSAIAPLPLTVAGAFGGTDRVFVHARERIPLRELGWEHFA
ncbi:MAG TPA: thiamine-phosphate kinase [Actinomycetota bacterium]|nr:thiamine-phosphate kinase [Actinomycetota bacterium]